MPDQSMKPTIRIEHVGAVTHEQTGAVVHHHDVHEGDQKVGSFQVLQGDAGRTPQFKLSGIKLGHAEPILRYIRANQARYTHPDATKSLALRKAKRGDADIKAAKEAKALESMPGYAAGGGSQGLVSGPPGMFNPPSKQRLTCPTPDCGKTLSIVEVRNTQNFADLHYSCPNCGISEKPILRRRATARDEATLRQDQLHAQQWAAEDAVAKAVSASETTDAPIELDLDRRRVQMAIRALLGNIETPASPNGKVNAALKKSLLAKSIASEQRYESVLSDLHGVSQEIASRPFYHENHDHAAFMAMYARDHLARANDLLQIHATKPRRVDALRTALGLKPMHDKHLDAAEKMVHAAKVLTVAGDNAMHEVGYYDTPTPYATANADIKPPKLDDIKPAYQRHGHLVPGSAAALKKRVLGGPTARLTPPPIDPDGPGISTTPRPRKKPSVRLGPFRIPV